jgi:hypothetical protein
MRQVIHFHDENKLLALSIDKVAGVNLPLFSQHPCPLPQTFSPCTLH